MDMVSTSLKTCQSCQSKFSPAKTAPNQKYCSRKCSTKDWQSNNKERHNQRVRAYRQRRSEQDGHWRDEGQKARLLKQWMIELKSQPCHDCKQSFETCCMDFDHRVGTEKKYNIGSMFAHHYSRELIQQELDKCDLVCANCHRIRTKHRRLGSKNKAKNLA